MLVLQDGRVVQQGSPGDLGAHPGLSRRLPDADRRLDAWRLDVWRLDVWRLDVWRLDVWRLGGSARTAAR